MLAGSTNICIYSYISREHELNREFVATHSMTSLQVVGVFEEIYYVILSVQTLILSLRVKLESHAGIIVVWGTRPFTREEGSGNIATPVLSKWNVVNVIFTTLWTATRVGANRKRSRKYQYS